MERQLSALGREQSALLRDRDNGFPVDSERLVAITQALDAIEADRAALEARWTHKRQAAMRVLDARRQLALTEQDVPPAAPGDAQPTAPLAPLSERQAALEQARQALAELQGEQPTGCSPRSIPMPLPRWFPIGRAFHWARCCAMPLAVCWPWQTTSRPAFGARCRRGANRRSPESSAIGAA